jgi:hypothetical protein
MGNICHAGIVITKRTFECFSAFIIVFTCISIIIVNQNISQPK